MINKEELIRMQINRVYPKRVLSNKFKNILLWASVGYIVGMFMKNGPK